MLSLVVMPLVMMAQMKIATVNVQSVFDAMPETKLANEQLEKASQQYKERQLARAVCSVPG